MTYENKNSQLQPSGAATMSQVSKQKRFSKKLDQQGEPKLTVCDITGHWGLYQWNLLIFSLTYGLICGLITTIGPLWTLDLEFECLHNETLVDHFRHSADPEVRANVAALAREPCLTLDQLGKLSTCSRFAYKDGPHGRILTNEFELVCGRQWLRSVVTSSSLIGFLLSAVVMNLLSDRYGRLVGVRLGCLLAFCATLTTIVAPNYILFNLAYAILSFALIGVLNSLGTLIMEATSAKLRWVAVVQFGAGWGAGMACCSLLSRQTRDFRLTLLVALGCQLLLHIWLYLGIFESIRWLLAEGKLTQAQVDLQRVCRINRVKNGAKLAQKIAQIQLNELRRVSNLIERKLESLDPQGDEAERLSLCNQQLRKSLREAHRPQVCHEPIEVIVPGQIEQLNEQQVERGPLSPTLMRQSFTLRRLEQFEVSRESAEAMREIIWRSLKAEDRNSLAAQALVQLALEQSRAIQREQAGQNFLAQLFHPKFLKLTMGLILLNIMTEFGYYGLVQTNSIVGLNVDFNYLAGALSEWLADMTVFVVLWALSRRYALALPATITVCILFGIVLNFRLQPLEVSSELNTVINSTLVGSNRLSVGVVMLSGENLKIYQQRELVNFWLCTIGKLTIAVTSLVGSNIVMEIFPANLRQTAMGTTIFLARIISTLAPSLFQDLSLNKEQIQVSLMAAGLIGLVGIFMSFNNIKNMKHKDLADNFNEC